MRNAIILHGWASKDEYYGDAFPSLSNCHWFPWLQKQLIINEIKADTPEVPHPFKFEWGNWVKEVKRFDIDKKTILVGHSMGAGFWVRFLSEHPEIQVAKVILVAPWLNLNHEEDTDFFDFKLRPDIALQSEKFVVFASDNDSSDVNSSVNYLREKLADAKFVDFHNYGHFCYKDMKTDAFPELLNEIVVDRDQSEIA